MGVSLATFPQVLGTYAMTLGKKGVTWKGLTPGAGQEGGAEPLPQGTDSETGPVRRPGPPYFSECA